MPPGLREALTGSLPKWQVRVLALGAIILVAIALIIYFRLRPIARADGFQRQTEAVAHCSEWGMFVLKGAGNNAPYLLDQAAWTGCVNAAKILLQEGADVNGVRQESVHMGPGRIDSPLSYATARGDLDMADLLVRKGADLNWNGSLPLLMATQKGQTAMVKWLVQKGAKVPPVVRSPMMMPGQPYDFLDRIAERGNYKELADYLRTLLAPARARQTKLFEALRRCDQKEVDALLVQGADINGTTPEELSRPLFVAMQSGCKDLSKTLIERGADVNWQWDYAGSWKEYHSPLQTAVIKGWLELFRLILSKDRTSDAWDWRNWTALMYAARRGDETMVRLLIAACADPEKYDRKGRTAITLAEEYRHPKLVALLHPDPQCEAKALQSIPAPFRARHTAAKDEERQVAQQLRKQAAQLQTASTKSADRTHVHTFTDVPDDMDEPLTLQRITRTGDKRVPVTLPHQFKFGGFNIVVKSVQMFTDAEYIQRTNNSHMFMIISVDETQSRDQHLDVAHLADVVPPPPPPDGLSIGCMDASVPGPSRQYIPDPWIPKKTRQELVISYGFGGRQASFSPTALWFIDGGLLDLTKPAKGITHGGIEYVFRLPPLLDSLYLPKGCLPRSEFPAKVAAGAPAVQGRQGLRLTIGGSKQSCDSEPGCRRYTKSEMDKLWQARIENLPDQTPLTLAPCSL